MKLNMLLNGVLSRSLMCEKYRELTVKLHESHLSIYLHLTSIAIHLPGPHPAAIISGRTAGCC